MDLATPTMIPALVAKQGFTDSSLISPLELIHPDGMIRSLMVIGSNCPARLLPANVKTKGEAADLIILAPNLAECRKNGWLENSIQLGNRFLAEDGVLYVLAPPFWRPKIKRLLRSYGLILDSDITHFPNWNASRFIVPLKPALLQYAFHQLMPTRLWKKKFILSLLQTPGGLRLVGNLHPWVAFAARRTQGRCLFNWLYQEDGVHPQDGNAIMHASWRRERGSIAIFRFSSNTIPDRVGKLAWSKESTFPKNNEVQLIPSFGPMARAAGAHIADILSVQPFRDRKIYYQSVIPGQLAAALLLERPGHIYELMRRVAGWLESWHQMTKISQRLNRQWFERELLSPAISLAAFLEGDISYLDWLSERCEAFDMPIPLFPAHNDLSMWNVLLDKQGQIGVVDWNSAREKCFPYIDLLYAMTDAAMIATGHKQRIKAFKECFTRNGKYSSFTKQILCDLQAHLDIPRVVLDISFHICFIGHAFNEQKWSEPDEPLQFLEIVRYLSQNRDELREWISS
jgi:hypothetical protein